MRYNPYYIAARLCRKAMPEIVAHKLLSRRTHTVERLYYGQDNMSNARTYLQAIADTPAKELFEQNEKIVALEAGSGLYNPLSAPLMLAGVERLILLEPFIGAEFDKARFDSRFREFLDIAEKDAGYPLKRIRRAGDVIPGSNDSSGNGSDVEFLARYWEDTGLPDSSVDLILSASVLEHLRNPEAVIAECARILKPGGYMINVVDMRDHFFKYPMEMLKYPPWAWKLLTTNEGGSGYQNRLRINQWIKLLDAQGFNNLTVPNVIVDEEELERESALFHKGYNKLGFHDLRVLHATLVSNKTASDL